MFVENSDQGADHFVNIPFVSLERSEGVGMRNRSSVDAVRMVVRDRDKTCLDSRQ
jgi:hypothetical protein